MSGRLPSDGMPHDLLPDPESEQLAALLGDGTARLVYGLLYRRRSSPPTAAEIGLFLSAAASVSMPADRVVQSLQTHFDITKIDRDGGTRYELRDWAPQHKATGLPALSLQRRARALAPGLCFQCGRSPEKQGVPDRLREADQGTSVGRMGLQGPEGARGGRPDQGLLPADPVGALAREHTCGHRRGGEAPPGREGEEVRRLRRHAVGPACQPPAPPRSPCGSWSPLPARLVAERRCRPAGKRPSSVRRTSSPAGILE